MPNLARSSLAALLLTASAASAEIVVRETVVHDTTTPVTLELDAETVLCSSADYGALHLKVLIPQLAHITLLDHQNLGAGAPCVAAGPCAAGNRPSDIISTKSPNEATAISVKAIRIDEVDTEAQTCTTTLRETVDVDIRGKAFKHERFSSLGTRAASYCTAPPAPVQPPYDDKADQQTPGDAKADAGGCDTGGSSNSGIVLLGLAALIVALRRR